MVAVVVVMILCLGLMSGKASAALPLRIPGKHGADCPKPPLPAFEELKPRATLPNPFEWSDGSGTVTTRAQWRCRRAEIGEELQHYQLGLESPGALQIFAPVFGSRRPAASDRGQGDASLTLTAAVALPAGEGPFPAVIGVGWPTGSLPPGIFADRGIATVQFNFMEIADVYTERGVGPFYRLYPADIGKYAAWAWGVSRIIDGLEVTQPEHRPLAPCHHRLLLRGQLALYAGA